MSWALACILVLTVWALEFIFSFPPWIPLLLTALILAAALAQLVLRRLRALKSASALRDALASLGRDHALGARPDRRAEIEALARQFQSGLTALERSWVGRRRGASALYALPWYMIVGPPGAGKTTAIRHSGLDFPSGGVGSGPVRGVGGTRNCDWWFTNDAILLDTAGRFAVEADDREEWMAFLRLLQKHRRYEPINGVIIAMSIGDVSGAGEQQIAAWGKKLRARIDEVMTELAMVVPVYVLFTKCDLLPGFTQLFGDLDRSGRAQAWGATIALDRDPSNPGGVFDAEMDLLLDALQPHVLTRLQTERSREAKNQIVQFPLELAGLRDKLSELITTTFAPNRYQATPSLRGFYFTSGTQEGRALDGVLARMSARMGLPAPPPAALPVVPKSYFLHDVFKSVIFPDANVAARTREVVRREAMMRVAVSAAAVLLGIVVLAPAIASFGNNLGLVHDVAASVSAARRADYGTAPGRWLPALDALREQIVDLDHQEQSVPIRLGWLMYRGDRVRRPAVAAYAGLVESASVLPVKRGIEARLEAATSDRYLEGHRLLESYLVLADVEHLDVDEAAYQRAEERGQSLNDVDGAAVSTLTARWAESLRPSSDLPEPVLQQRLRPHVRSYLRLVKSGRAAPVTLDQALVERVRARLRTISRRQRDDQVLVQSVAEERRCPPLTLADVFKNRPDVLEVLTSARHLREHRWQEIEGPYTRACRARVLQNFADGVKLIGRARWVVPLAPEERSTGLVASVIDVAAAYRDESVAQWDRWLQDITVHPRSTPSEAAALWAKLAEPDWPYLRLLRTLEDETQVEIPLPLLRLLPALTPLQRLSKEFEELIQFGVPPKGKEAPLSAYVSTLEALSRQARLTGGAAAHHARPVEESLTRARAQAKALVEARGPKARAVLTAWLLDPLGFEQAERGGL